MYVVTGLLRGRMICGCCLFLLPCHGGDQVTVISWALLYRCAEAEYGCTVEQ